MIVSVVVISITENTRTTPYSNSTHPYTHDNIWIDRRKEYREKSCDDNKNIINSIVSGAEPYSTNIETIILIFWQENRWNNIDYKGEEANNRHRFTMWYPSDEIFINNPSKNSETRDNHNVSFNSSKKCFDSLRLIQGVDTTKIVCSIEKKIKSVKYEATWTRKYTRDNFDDTHRNIASTSKCKSTFQFYIFCHRKKLFVSKKVLKIFWNIHRDKCRYSYCAYISDW